MVYAPPSTSLRLYLTRFGGRCVERCPLSVRWSDDDDDDDAGMPVCYLERDMI